MPARVRGVVLLAPVLLLGACSAGSVDVDVPTGPHADATACAPFLAALPATVDGLDARDVSPDDAPGRAWGDPPLVVTCGVELPVSTNPLDTCNTVHGVDWFVPRVQYVDQKAEVTITAVGFRPIVSLQVPPDYRGGIIAAALVPLSDVVKAQLRAVDDECS